MTTRLEKHLVNAVHQDPAGALIVKTSTGLDIQPSPEVP